MSQYAMEGKERNKRLSVNAINFFATCLFLFFAVQFSDGGGGFATKINEITANLGKAVLGLDDNVTYTDYNDTSSYYSSTQFNAKGMAGLYNLTKMFIDIVVPRDILMDGVLYIDNSNNIQANIPDPADTLYYYRKLVAVVLFLVLCVLLFPLCGLCFCCCRCCGNCGARSLPADKKKDTCKKIIHGTLLIVLGTGLLFCVVCAFGSNQQLQEGVDSFPDNMKKGISDTKTYLESTNNQISHLLGDNYQEFADAFTRTMDASSDTITEQLEEYSSATSMTSLYNFTQNIDKVNASLYSLKENSNKLRVYASQLNDALRKVKRDLLKTLTECHLEDCNAIKNNISTLSTNIDFNKLPDVTGDIDSLRNLNISNIQQAAKTGQDQLKNVEKEIKKHLADGLDAAKKQIKNTETTINTNLKTITDAVKEVKTQIDDSATPAVNKAQEYIRQYGKYPYYVGLAISCVLLLVTICIALGLICGICGKRPDGYNDNCCNKGAGSQFLLCAVMIMFLFGFVISVITIVFMVLGVFTEKGICEPIQYPDPKEFRVWSLLDGYDLQLDLKVKPTVLLNMCHQNQSAFKTFNLNDKFKLDEIIANFNIDEQLDKLNIDESIFTNFEILNETNIDILRQLLEFQPTANLDQFGNELNETFTNYSLRELSERLGVIILNSESRSNYTNVTAQLQLSVLHLNTYNDKLLVPMKSLANDVMNNALELRDLLKMGENSFSEAVEKLIHEIKEAQKNLQVDGPATLKKVIDQFKVKVKNQVNSYIYRVKEHIEDKIGRCGPLSLVINSAMTSTCYKVVVPWNGFWFSLLWSIILYVLIIIISIKLANLYQKYKTNGHYVETRGAKRGKKKGKKSKRYEERTNVVNEVAREYAAGSRPPDGRYADMAPKHWEEFPNGGPPHYQRAPTEYERPPPYYYPGSGGEQ